jgi:regulatory protein
VDDADAKARGRALRFLEHQDRTCREVEQRLVRYGYTEDVVSGVVQWLRELDYLDDARFAQNLAAQKRREGWGPVRIRQTLLRKGVSAGLTAAAIEEPPDLDALVALVRRRFAVAAAAEPAAARRKAGAFLARKGHTWEVIAVVLARALGAGVEEDLEAGET